MCSGSTIATFWCMATRKSPSKNSKGGRKIHKVMKEHKEGKLKSGSGRKVKSRKQAVAIALSEARKSGAHIPRKSSAKKKASKKTATKKKSSAKSKS